MSCSRNRFALCLSLTALGSLGALTACGDDFNDCQTAHTCPSSTPPEPEASGGSGEPAPETGDVVGGQTGGGDTVPNVAPGGAGGEGGAGGTTDAELGGGGQGSEPMPEPVDVTPPSVVSVSPADGELGVAADAVITIEWSEPMNKSSAKLAFESPELAGRFTVEWQDERTMVVRPSEPLAYATGAHAKLNTLMPKLYSIALSTAAEDVAGNALSQAYTFSFVTLRPVAVALKPKGIYDLGYSSFAPTSPDYGGHVGDNDNNSGARVAVDFDLSSIPAEAVDIAKATFSIDMLLLAPSTQKKIGNAFSLGSVELVHIFTPSIDADTMLQNPLATLGTLASSGTPAGYRSLDVTEGAADDLAKRAARKQHSQYRVQFTSLTNNNDAADALIFAYDHQSALSLEYLIP